MATVTDDAKDAGGNAIVPGMVDIEMGQQQTKELSDSDTEDELPSKTMSKNENFTDVDVFDMTVDRDLIVATFAEGFGTFLFQFVGGLAASGVGGGGITQAAIGNGVGLTVSIAHSGQISGGHYNPAVSWGMFVSRQMTFLRTFFYIVAQLIGAVAGAGVNWYLLQPEVNGFLIQPAPGIDNGRAFVAEMLATMLFVMVVWGTAYDNRGWGNIAPILIGFTIMVNVFAIGGISGGAINPARAFGPAAVYGDFNLHWIYWVACLLGGSIGALIYRYILAIPTAPTKEV